jgi:hypothetical protein
MRVRAPAAVTRMFGASAPARRWLEAGKTKVHYNGVAVGTVSAIRLSDDHQRVVTTVEMSPGTEDFLVEDTQFWVVTPRVSGANITGLGTLISGAYIGMEIGGCRKRVREFQGLDTPPVVESKVPGRSFALEAFGVAEHDRDRRSLRHDLRRRHPEDGGGQREREAAIERVFGVLPELVIAARASGGASGIDLRQSLQEVAVRADDEPIVGERVVVHGGSRVLASQYAGTTSCHSTPTERSGA